MCNGASQEADQEVPILLSGDQRPNDGGQLGRRRLGSFDWACAAGPGSEAVRGAAERPVIAVAAVGARLARR
eukprot:5949344-Prymnesium_polylepis.1